MHNTPLPLIADGLAFSRYLLGARMETDDLVNTSRVSFGFGQTVVEELPNGMSVV